MKNEDPKKGEIIIYKAKGTPLLLRQLKMLILSGIGNFRMLEVIANMRQSFNKGFHARYLIISDRLCKK